MRESPDTNETNEIEIEEQKEVKIAVNIAMAIFVALDTDFFQLPITDSIFIIDIVFWLCMFSIVMSRVVISERGIKIYVLFVRIKFVDSKRINRIEIIHWRHRRNSVHAIFEYDNCPKFHDGPIMSLYNYLTIHFFKTIDYEVAEQRRDYVVNQIETMFGDKEILDYTANEI